jgi:hypothetical protein
MNITNKTTIVVGRAATAAENTAAEALRDSLFKLEGVTLKIRTDRNDYQSRIEVGFVSGGLIGSTQTDLLTCDGYMYAARGNVLHITAKTPRGVIYGVYSLLEQEFGCRYFVGDDFYIPKLTALEVKDGTIVTYSPPFSYRDFDAMTCFTPEYGMANKQNGMHYHLEEKHGEPLYIDGFAHTLPHIVPHDRYFDAHPEYFALIDGARRKRNPQNNQYTQLCFSNPDIVPITVEYLLARKRMNPRRTIFDVSMTDGYAYCECDACRAAQEKYNARSAPFLTFINAVAKEVKKEYPDMIIDTLAYLHLRRPPQNFPPIEDNIMVRVCSIECCGIHALGECDFFEPKIVDRSDPPVEILDDYRGWRKLTDKVYAWDYVMCQSFVFLPWPNFDVIQKNLQSERDCGIRGVMLCGTYYTEWGSYAALRGYLYAKCLWNPDCNLQAHRAEFMTYYYGDAAAAMTEAIAYLEARNLKYPYHTICGSRGENLKWYDADFIREYGAMLERAEYAVRDNPKILKRVQTERICIPFAEAAAVPADAPDFAEKVDVFINYYKSLNAGRLTEFASTEKQEAFFRLHLADKDWYGY